MERLLVPRRLLLLRALYYPFKIDCKEKGCTRQTVFFTALDTMSDAQEEEYRVKATKGTLQEQVESDQDCNIMDANSI